MTALFRRRIDGNSFDPVHLLIMSYWVYEDAKVYGVYLPDNFYLTL